MEMGADAVLVNTAIAVAGDPVRMARAFAMAVEAGRDAFEAGLGADARRPPPLPRRPAWISCADFQPVGCRLANVDAPDTNLPIPDFAELQQLLTANSHPAEVRRALQADRLDIHDLAALLSPAANDLLPQLAARSAHITAKRFGRTIQIYAPLYLVQLLHQPLRLLRLFRGQPH